MYEGINQVQEMKRVDVPPQPQEDVLTYDRYKHEREEIITDHEKDI